MVEVRGLQRTTPPKEMEEIVMERFKDQFGDDIVSVYIAPNYTNSYIAQKEIDFNRERQEHFKTINEKEGKQALIKVKICGPKVDAVEHFGKEIDKFQKEFDSHLDEGENENSGFAYVTVKHPDVAQNIEEQFKEKNKEYKTLNWSINKAPAPHEIKWENLKYDPWMLRGRRICLLVTFVIVFFVLVTPTAFVRYINAALSGVGFKQYISGIFDTFLPTLLLIIYQQVILYHAIIFLVKQEKRSSVAMDVASRLTYYLIFMSIYVFLAQALGLQTIVQVTVDGWDKWRTLLPNKIIETGLFFMIFLIHLTFISQGLALLQPGIVIVQKIMLKLAKTPLEEMRALEAKPFDFSFELAISLNSFLIVISYTVAYPLISVIGLVFFSLRVINI